MTNKKTLNDLRDLLPNHTVAAGIPTADELPPMEPIDRVARRVTSKGEHHRFPNPTEEVCVTTAPEMRPVPVECGMPDMTGMRCGRMLVIGLSNIANNAGRWKRDLMDKDTRNPGGARWVCRCDCGMYTLRSTRAIAKSNENTSLEYEDACFECRALDRLRNPSLQYPPCPACGFEYSVMRERPKGNFFRCCKRCYASTAKFIDFSGAAAAWRAGDACVPEKAPAPKTTSKASTNTILEARKWNPRIPLGFTKSPKKGVR